VPTRLLSPRSSSLRRQPKSLVFSPELPLDSAVRKYVLADGGTVRLLRIPRAVGVSVVRGIELSAKSKPTRWLAREPTRFS